MFTQKFRDRLLVVLVVASLVLSGSAPVIGRASAQVSAPTIPTDETKVPHYFGPYPNWANTPFTLPDVVVTITGDGTGATAVASVGANGSVTGITLTNPGFGYTYANVAVNGAGTGALATAQVALSGAVASVTVDTPGAYYKTPAVGFSLPPLGNGALVWVGNPLRDRAFATDSPAPGTDASDSPDASTDTDNGTEGSANGKGSLVVLSAALPTGILTEFLSWNQATAGGSATPSAGQNFIAYVLRPTGTPDEYFVVFASGTQTVPALADQAVSELSAYPVGSVDVQAGDVIAFYGAGIPADTGAGADIVSSPGPVAPLQGDTITLGGAGFPLSGEARTYSFAASVIDPSRNVDAVPATATAY
jgi:hypothetical protein